MLKDLLADQFQYTVSEQLLCGGNILDILSKHQECSVKINRSIVKAVTGCGCLKIDVKKKVLSENSSIADIKKMLESNVSGQLCDQCIEIIETEIGRSLVYLAALCNQLDLNLFDIMIKEHDKMRILKYYSFT
ncbi:hypothetical protein [Desulfofalx alkaliphila]|uniref:hypothetical protein n=1 Tax=Desulfofalx alkaliphila TaxID=105483 RepID=UPI0004E28053|nr:hypothetical protein [Desulfofalx alkaliphila]